MTYTVNLQQQPGMFSISRADGLAVYFGNPFDRSITPTNYGPYQATVSDGVTSTPYSIPRHDWFARWVHDPLPDTIIRDEKQIVAQGLMFSYGNPGTKLPPKPTNKFSGPMDTAGITTDMGNTGERPDIGLLPEWEAYALRTGDFGPCLEAAKGFDSMPIFRIDAATGRFIDPTTHPTASENSNIQTAGGGQWAMEIGHHPRIYIAYLATGKLRYLESCQAVALWSLQVNNWYTISAPADGKMPIIHRGQARGCAWSTASIIAAWNATKLAEKDYPGGLPAPLLPSSVFKAVLDANLAYTINGYVKDLALQVFRYHPDKNTYRGSWQFDYELNAEAFWTLSDPAAAPLYLWSFGNTIWRLNGKSGYPPAHQSPYTLRCGPKDVMPDGGNNFPFDIPASSFFNTPGEAWLAYANEIIAAGGGENMTVAQIQALLADPFGGGDFINWDNYTPCQLRQVMAEADILDKMGIPVTATWPDFPVCRDRITSMVSRWEARTAGPGGTIASRVSIVSGTVTAPPTTNPPPTTGVITMSLNGSLFVGQSENFTLTFHDAAGNALTPPSDLAVKASPDGIVSLSGDTVTAVAPGSFTLDISGTGFSSATLAGSVSPLGIITAAWA